MNSKIATFALLALAVIGWVFVVVVLAQDTSIFKSGSFGCGVFKCHHRSFNLGEDCDMEPKVDAMKAFGVISVLFLSVTMIVHFSQAVGCGALVPPVWQPYIKFVHLIAAVFLFIFWIIMVMVYMSDCDQSSGTSFPLRDHVYVHFGIFFVVLVMLFEISNFFLCRVAESDCDTDGVSLINKD